MDKKGISRFRQDIDELDRRIINLLNQRAKVAVQIGKVKAANGTPTLDSNRENEVLDSVEEQNCGPFPPSDLKGIFRQIMTTCREIQEEHPDPHVVEKEFKKIRTRKSDEKLMPLETTYNTNIEGIRDLPTPEEVMAECPLTETAAKTVVEGREQIQRILDRKDDRHLMIVGPCSIHNIDEALIYAERLSSLAQKVRDRILLTMRVYFEKPRTTLGWKGLIYDPAMDDSSNVGMGLRSARKVLMEIAMMGLPTATELVDPVIPQYITDLLSWAAIGARTAESQTHRQMASGLSMPIGIKNSTDGNMNIAIQAVKAAASKHAFIGIMEDGRVGEFHTLGNKYGHLVLRGGQSSPNFGEEYIAFARELMRKAGLAPNIMVDCSHGNSRKVPERQADVMRDVVRQIVGGNSDIIGTMVESNLVGGKQDIPADGSSPKWGISVTDACLGWGETESLIREAYGMLQKDMKAQAAG